MTSRFTAPGRAMGEEDRINLLSVGVDIGSATSHLIFSRLVLERVDGRYVATERATVFESEILLTPYAAAATIDSDALGRFIAEQYRAAGVARASVDTGALILTGVALLRENARAVADLFAREAGKFVAVSAGDNLEALMAAHGSGAIARSSEAPGTVLNVDIGGGTTKLVQCSSGRAAALAALDVGARMVVTDAAGRVTRLEPAGRRAGAAVGITLAVGEPVDPAGLDRIAAHMAERVVEAVGLRPLSEATRQLLRTAPLPLVVPTAITFSGGVSEYIYGRAAAVYGDLGPRLAAAVLERARSSGVPILAPAAGIRATVVGASQYTVQVSGSTIFLSPIGVTPLRNVPVIEPAFPLDDGELTVDAGSVAAALRDELQRFDLLGDQPVALAVRWCGAASYDRIDGFCRGVVAGLGGATARREPLLLVFDGDVGGLLGLHLKEELGLATPLASIDGVDLRAFDYIDVGALIPTSGAVPVVIKSLVFSGVGPAPSLRGGH